MKTGFRLVLPLLCVLALSLSGCGESHDAVSGASPSPDEGERKTSDSAESMSELLDRLTGTNWVLVEWTDVALLPGHDDLPGRSIVLSFLEDGQFAAQAPVNRIAGGMSVGPDGYLAMEKQIVSTKMAGPPILMDLESRFIKELSEMREIMRDQDQIVLISEDLGSMHFLPVEEAE